MGNTHKSKELTFGYQPHPQRPGAGAGNHFSCLGLGCNTFIPGIGMSSASRCPVKKRIILRLQQSVFQSLPARGG